MTQKAPIPRRLSVILICINLLLLVVNLVWLIQQASSQPGPSHNDYPLLSKRIFAESQNDILINFTPLRSAMRSYLEKQPERIGVYFEYLPSGTSIGINDQMEVRLASLIKVPVVMAVYKETERQKLSTDTEIEMKPEDIDKRYGDLWKRGVGTKITIQQAIDLSLIESDNTATRMLVHHLPEMAIDAVFDSLDLPKDREAGAAVISPKSYTSILRSLYLSSYLTRDHSSVILQTLTRTKFTDMIPAGVPNDVKVAHKIGIFDEPGSTPVFNDCGIIYVTDRPYALCIMVAGNEAVAHKHMQHLSKMVYGYVKASR